MTDKTISLRFVAGIERNYRLPKFIAKAGLTHRFATIQDTYVEGYGEMYFDEALWKALVALVSGYDERAEVFVAANFKDIGRKEKLLPTFLQEWQILANEDKDPPEFVALKIDGALRLCMLTEYWSQIGGPQPYSDSYTYSIFSDRDLGGEIVSILRATPDAYRWDIDADVIQAQDLPVPSFLARIFSWLIP